MTHIDEFVTILFGGKGFKEKHSDFTKYFNDQFEVLVFDNRVVVKDKRATKTNVYNNLHIAKAQLALHHHA